MPPITVTERHEPPDRLHSVSHVVPPISPCFEQEYSHGRDARRGRGPARAVARWDRWCPRCDGQAHWLDGGADVAETTYTAFAGTRHETTARLIIRRVRPTPGSQLAMDVVFSYHAILRTATGRCSPWRPITAGTRSWSTPSVTSSTTPAWPTCRWAVSANAAWLALVGVAYNLASGPRTPASGVTTKTLRVTVIAVPARLRLGTPGPERAFDHSTRDPRG